MQERETLGEYLRREREQKNLPLRELAKKTKVREQFLKAIEEDRHDLLPSPIYVRGFISAYAKCVGLDPHDVLLRYEWLFKKEEILPPEERPRKKPLKKVISISWPIWTVSGVVALSLLISYFLHPYLSGPRMESFTKKKEASAPLIIPSAPQAPDLSRVDQGKSFSLEMRAVEEVWVKIQINGGSPTEALFKPGEGISHQANHRIELLVGNAGGLDIVFNGELQKRFGKPGEVVTLVVTSRGVEKKGQGERKEP